MIPTLKSLNTKLLLIVVCIVALGGVLAAVRQQRVEAQRTQAIYDQRLQRLGASYQQRMAEELQQRQQLLGAAHAALIQQLSADNDHLPVPPPIPRDQDQAWRLFDGISAVFVHRDAELDEQTQSYIFRSQPVWEQLIPLLSSSFRAVFFITETRMTRIWPAHIVAEHLPDHDVTRELFYTLATPANNPSRAPRWTPIYYDFYAQEWMISLILPVYRHEQFIGVMGADLDARFLLERLPSLQVDDDEIKAFIFDNQGRLIISSDLWRPAVANLQADNLLNTASAAQLDIAGYINDVIKGHIARGTVEVRQLNGGEQHISYYPLNNMNWYISLYYPKTAIDEKLKTTLIDMYTNIILLTLFVSLVLYFGINYVVIKRVRALAEATASVSRENWSVTVPEQGNDELSVLARCINVMLLKINDLVEGLNANIEQLQDVNLKAKKLMTAIENSTSIVVILNRDWHLEYANAQFWQSSGYTPADGLTGDQALLFTREMAESCVLDDIIAMLTEGHALLQKDWRAEYLALRKDGSGFWMMQSVSAVFSAVGELEYFVAVGHDSTDLKLNQQKMEQLAYYDHLTGLHNRILFKDQLRIALHASQRDKSHFALMYLDLDHFKRINDTLGHEAGDTLLIEVARRIRHCLREEDIVARLGGDEFAVLLPQVGSAQYAYVVANKIITALNQPLPLEGQEVVVGVSIGITLAPDDTPDLDALMKNADLAMYQAKEKGRNTLQFYTADMNEQVEYRLALESDLRSAIKNQEFELYYQPIVCLKTYRTVSAEALLRWHHPTRGLVSPEDFIPVAEESGLIVPIGKWVMRTACQQAKNIHKALRVPLKIAVNVSARQLRDNGFVTAVQAALDEILIAPEWLSVELTETTLMEEGDKAIERLQRLRAMGIGISIDDFGTGFSSLSQLKRLPVNTLKIDRSFVEGLPGDEEDRAITTLIVAMANSLNYEVVVEGVETASQLTFLTLCDCDFAQGFYFSKPLPSDQLMQLLFEEAAREDESLTP